MNRFVRPTRLAYRLAQPRFANYCSKPDSKTNLRKNYEFLLEENKKLSKKFDEYETENRDFKRATTIISGSVILTMLVVVVETQIMWSALH